MALPLIDERTAVAQLRPLLDWPLNVRPERLALLETVLTTIENGRFPGAIIPRYMNGTMVYYAMAATASEWRRLVPLMRSAVGSTVSDFTGLRVELKQADPLEATLSAIPGLIGARFTAGSDQARGRFTLSALARLCTLLDEAPLRREIAPRATGEVLRSFELSIAGLDRVAAQESLAFLSANRRLDALNLRFLTVRLHAEFKEWDELRGLDFFSALCQVRRSSAVTNAMTEALYQTAILPAEFARDPTRALAIFKRDFHGNSGSLFARLPPHPTPAAAKAFALSALSFDPVNASMLDSLEEVAADWSLEDLAFFHDLLSLSTGIRRPTTEAAADPFAVLQDDDLAATVEAAIAGMLAAIPLEDLRSAQLVLDYVNRLPEEDRRELLERRVYRAIYEDLCDRVGGDTVPTSWTQWLEMLASAPVDRVLSWAATAVHEWPVPEQLSTVQDAHHMADAMSRVPPSAQDKLLDTLPFIVSWVRGDPRWPFRPAIPLYTEVYEFLTLLLSSGWRREALSAAKVVLDGLLELAPNQSEYTRALDQMCSVIPQEAGLSDIEGLLDLVELAVIHTCPDPDAKQRLWARTYGALSPMQARFSRDERALANQLGGLFGMPSLFPEPAKLPEESSQRQWLNGKTVAVYTLTESVGERVRSLLEQLYPGITVRLSYDKVASPQLDDLARKADVFIICWRSAAHAATNRITQLRPKTAPTLWSEGKGSSSILRSLHEFIVEAA